MSDVVGSGTAVGDAGHTVTIVPLSTRPIVARHVDRSSMGAYAADNHST